jgi:hypothetical protein
MSTKHRAKGIKYLSIMALNEKSKHFPSSLAKSNHFESIVKNEKNSKAY